MSEHTRPDRRAAGVARNRRSIVEAARNHLVAAGFHRLSLEEVAADAGVTRVTIYRHFGSKLGLLDAVGEDLAHRADVVARVREASDVADPVTALRAVVAEFCRFWSTDPALFRRLIGLSSVDPEARRVVDDREQWRYERISDCIHRLDSAARLLVAPGTAVAGIGAVTGFTVCDEIAFRLDIDHSGLEQHLLPLLTGLVRMT